MSPLHSRTMQGVNLALAVIGYLAPGVPMVVESARSGNLLFWTDPLRTTSHWAWRREVRLRNVRHRD